MRETTEPTFDLVLLVADGNMRAGVMSVLARPESLGIRRVTVDDHVHPDRDPGCLGRAHEFLRSQSRRARYAMVMFDREGCGDERPRLELERDVESRLASSGWKDRCAVIVVEPEFDAWMWSRSPHLERALGWSGRSPSLRDWLETHHFLKTGAIKPARPKEALEAALRVARQPRSSSRYAEVGRHVSLAGCTDEAFGKLRATLQAWFGEPGG